MSNLREKYPNVHVEGTTSGTTGAINCSDIADSIVREACWEHEGVHQGTILQGLRQFGGPTNAYAQWYTNSVNWANDEVAAYGAGIRYYKLALDWL